HSRIDGNTNTFPVQAMGFAGINDFKVRWINVPEAGEEGCGSSNTMSLSMYDDGTGTDENANQPLNPANPIGNNAVAFDKKEGPTDLRFTIDQNTGNLVGNSERADGTGLITFEYGRMDLLGTAASPVIAGTSIGGLTPGLAQTNLSQSGAIAGDGTDSAIYEVFDT